MDTLFQTLKLKLPEFLSSDMPQAKETRKARKAAKTPAAQRGENARDMCVNQVFSDLFDFNFNSYR